MKYPLSAMVVGVGCSVAAATANQPVSEQFPNTNPPEVPDVEVIGHILKPASLEPTQERLERLNLPSGFQINIFAEGLHNPRMLAVAEDGAVYVTRRSTGDVVRLEDQDQDGKADRQQIVANRPGMHGIAIDGSTVYLVTVKDLYRTTIQDDGSFAPLEHLLDNLPDAGQHPNRTIAVGPDGMLYLSVGSTCNTCEESNPENATMLQIAPDGSSRTIYARGLRNTIGFGFVPNSNELYGMDHGIDWLGDNEQHEELNRIVEDGHYGWPYLYDNDQYNPVNEPPGELTWSHLADQSIEPTGLYVPHAAPMQMTFYTGEQFPAAYQGDAFVAMRGSWNRKPPSGYEVLRIDFENGEPVAFEPFITGFLMQEEGTWGHLGRLAGITHTRDGALLISDDENGVIYRVAYAEDSATEQPETLEPTNPEGARIGMTNAAVNQPSKDGSSQLVNQRVTSGEVDYLEPHSPAFENQSPIPDTYAAEHENISPPIEWREGPEETKSYAVIVEDPDAPKDSPFVHWILYNIPADTHQLDEGIPDRPVLDKPQEALQGLNDRGSLGYFGPRPPEGDPAHHYHFQVFALDTTLDLHYGATRKQLVEAMLGHVLASGSFVGTYQR